MEFLRLPFYERLQSAQTVLLAGAGGGYDIFTGLPLYFGLRAAGKTVHLANLSFSRIFASNGKRIGEPGEQCVRIDRRSEATERYFPEMHLAQWFWKERREDVPIYCFSRAGPQPLIAAYRSLLEHLGGVDAIVLVDGGTDSLMRGDEPQLGTPEEDLGSLIAVDSLAHVPTRLLLCLGFGVDTFHGVCHHYFLEAAADLAAQGAFLGSWSLIATMPEVVAFRRAYDYTRRQQQESIVNGSILSAIEGRFGDWHETRRTEGSELYINPLMSLYWAFDATAVARRHLFLEQLIACETWIAMSQTIGRLHFQQERRPWLGLPV